MNQLNCVNVVWNNETVKLCGVFGLFRILRSKDITECLCTGGERDGIHVMHYAVSKNSSIFILFFFFF